MKSLTTLLKTGALLSLFEGCSNDSFVTQVKLEPQYPTSQDDLDCVVYEKRDIGGNVGFTVQESFETYDFHWLVNNTYLFHEEGHGWNRLEYENFTSGDEVLCSAWTSESSSDDVYEVGSAWVYIP